MTLDLEKYNKKWENSEPMNVACEFRSDRCVVRHVIDKGFLTNIEGYV